VKSVSIPVAEDAAVPFDRWLATELSRVVERPVPRGLARKAILAGIVALGGRIERNPGRLLKRGPSVFVRDLTWIPEAAHGEDQERDLHVLYEDPWLVVVEKPSGLPTHGTKDPNRRSLVGRMERRWGRKLFVHQRLDEGTSGAVLFVLDSRANAALARSFAEREVEKTYVALVKRPPADWPAEVRVETPLRVRKNGSVEVEPSGMPATTLIRVLRRSPEALLVEARPLTGRKHQIRVHLASLGAPILGDARYGGPPAPTGRLMLHAERLELDHPATGKRLRVISPRPDAFRLPPNLAALRPGSGHPREPDARSTTIGPRENRTAGLERSNHPRIKGPRRRRRNGVERGSRR